MGCGKSSVGKVLSARLGCPFTDLDAAIVERIGCTIPEFFARHGEADFRTLESDVLSATLSRHTLTGHSLPGHTPPLPSLQGTREYVARLPDTPPLPSLQGTREYVARGEGVCPAERRRQFRLC